MKNLKERLMNTASVTSLAGYAQGVGTILVASLLRDNPEAMDYAKVSGLMSIGLIGLGSLYRMGEDLVDNVRRGCTERN